MIIGLTGGIGSGKSAAGNIFRQHGITVIDADQASREVFEKDPTRLVTKAVYGMLPKNKLGSALNRNLRVFVGDIHGMDAQKPKLINLKDIK